MNPRCLRAVRFVMMPASLAAGGRETMRSTSGIRKGAKESSDVPQAEQRLRDIANGSTSLLAPILAA
jgi:hypothetical protein